MGLPQYWLSDEVRAGMERLAATARQRDVSIAIHTHVNAAQSVTPLVARAAKAMLDTGIRDVRNQGVLLRGVNDSPAQLLDLSFALLDEARIMPYYFYMCDMIPNSEHWRLSLGEAQQLQHKIMGYLPGFATPRIICDVPYVGKRWVHQVSRYDTESAASPTGPRTTGPGWRPTTRSRWTASTPTTTRSTCCPPRARTGGAAGPARKPRPPWVPPTDLPESTGLPERLARKGHWRQSLASPCNHRSPSGGLSG